jgi:outer membrane autotransporter protein
MPFLKKVGGSSSCKRWFALIIFIKIVNFNFNKVFKMNKNSLKKNLLTTASAFAIGAFASQGAFAAAITIGDATTTALGEADTLTFTGTANNVTGIATVADGLTIGTIVATGKDGAGTVRVAGDATFGLIGVTAARVGVLDINSNGASEIVTLGAAVFVDAVTLDGLATTQVNANLEATDDIDITAASKIAVANGINITATKIQAVGGAHLGTLTLAGDTTFTGDIGTTTTDGLNQITVSTASKTLTLVSQNVFGNNINFAADGTVVLDATTGATALNMTNGITTSTTNTGTLSLKSDGGAVTVTGEIGTSTKLLKEVKITDATNAYVLKGNVYATDLDFNNVDQTITVTGGKTIGGTITAGGDGVGTLTVDNTAGDTTISGLIGTSNVLDLKILNHTAGADGDVLTLNGSGTNYVATTNIGAGQVVLNGSLEGTVAFTNTTTGKLTVAAGKSITGAITAAAANKGTVEYAGAATQTGALGVIGGGNELALVTINAGTVTTTAAVAATTINFAADGALVIANGQTLEGAVTNTTTGQGTVTFAQGATMTGNLGVITTDVLKKVTIGGTTAGTVAASGNIIATDINFATDSTLTLVGGKTVSGTTISSAGTTTNFGTITVDATAADTTIASAIGTSATGKGLLVLNHIAGANGDVVSLTNTGTNYIGTTNIGAGQVAVTGDLTGAVVFAAAANATGALELADNSDLTGNVTATSDATGTDGTIKIAGSSNIDGLLGVTGSRLILVDVNSASASDIVRFKQDAFTKVFDADDAQSGTTIRIDQGKTVTATDSITAALAGAAKYQFGIKEVDGIATDAGDTVGKIASGAAILMTDASYDALIDGTGKSIVDGSVYKIADGVGAATVATNTTATDNSWRLSFSAVRGDNAAVTTALGAAGSNSDIYLLADVDNALNESSTKVNEKAVGSALETIGNSGDAALDTVTAALDGLSSAAAVETALATLDADVSGSTTAAAIDAADAGTGVVESRVEQLAGISGTGVAAGGAAYNNGVWGEVFGTAADQDDRKGVKGYQAETGGVAIGADTKLDDENTIGASLAYAQTDADSANGTSEIDSYQGNVYGTHDYGKWFANGLLGFTYNNFDTTRNIVVGTISDKAKGDFDGQQYTLKVGGGYKLDVEGGLNVTPVASLKYSYLALDKYTETGSSADLTIDNEDIHSLKSDIGVKLNYPIVDGSITYIPAVSTSWTYDFIGDEQETTNNFTGAASTLFTNKGAKVAQNAFNVGLGLDVLAQDNVTVSFDYDWNTKEDYDAHTGAVKARFAF